MLNIGLLLLLLQVLQQHGIITYAMSMPMCCMRNFDERIVQAGSCAPTHLLMPQSSTL
jgi:hypothetical protein